MKFNGTNSEFRHALQQRVDEYFTKHGIEKTGNLKLYIKTAILLVSFFILLILPYVMDLSLSSHIITYSVLGLVISGIGFGIAHDATHGSFSKSKLVNKVFSYSFDLVGVSHFFWKSKHNIAHHTYTNIEHFDDDIMTGNVFRFSEEQKWKWYHQFQHLYAFPLYCFLYIQWVYYKDFKKWAEGKVGNTHIPKMNISQKIILILSKIFHAIIFIIIPSFYFGFYEAILAYLAMSFVCGLIITVVFQLAHIQSKSLFPTADPSTGNIEKDWAIIQVETTANFENWNPIVTEFTGGLNFQTEHHLFPNISHVHYAKISKLVKSICEEYGVRYNEYKTLIGAMLDHLNRLRYLSQPAL